MARKTKTQRMAEFHKLDTGHACKAFRQLTLHVNQKDFWGRVGVTQSGGSRYESGRAIPESTQALLALVYCDADRVTEVVTALRSGVWDFNCIRPQAAPLASLIPLIKPVQSKAAAKRVAVPA